MQPTGVRTGNTNKEDNDMAEAEVVHKNKDWEDVVQAMLEEVTETDVVILDNKEEEEQVQELPTEKVKEI